MTRSILTVAASLAFLSSLCGPLPAQSPGFWEARPDLNVARQEVGAAVVGGKVYVAGGISASRSILRSVERYDPARGVWVFVAPMPTTLHHFGMAASGGQIYTVGGYISGFSGTDRCSRYDPAADRWTTIASLPQERGALAAVEIGGKIYAVGGVRRGGVVVGDLTVYDPATNRWTTRATMPTAREHLAAAAIGGKLYVAGGRRGVSNNKVLEVYDPATNRWQRLRDMPTARGGNGAAVLGGRLIVCGGEFPGVFPQTEEYDPATDTWRSLELMRPGLHGIYPVTVGDQIYVAGGATVAGFGAVKVVLSLSMLPDGVARYGTGTPACRGELRAHVSHRPRPSEPRFEICCTNAAPSAPGFLALGTTPDATGTIVLGFRTHLDLTQPILLVPVSTDPNGAVCQAVPIPSGTSGRTAFAQFIVSNTAGCGGAGTVSSSPGLRVTIR